MSEFPIHPGAAAFAKDRRPLSLSQMLEPLTNFLSVIGAGAAGGLALWGFCAACGRCIRTSTCGRSIASSGCSAGSEHDDSAPTLPLEFIDYLEGRLAQIKQAAIDDYAAGRFQGDDALMSILTLMADTRHLLVQRRKQVCVMEAASPARPNRRGRGGLGRFPFRVAPRLIDISACTRVYWGSSGALGSFASFVRLRGQHERDQVCWCRTSSLFHLSPCRCLGCWRRRRRATIRRR